MERTADSSYIPWRDRAQVWLAEQFGILEYWCRPSRRGAWGPFNGQEFRQRLFMELCARVPFVAIIETGTHRGTTTEYFRRTTGLPIHSFEANPRHHGFARARLRSGPDLQLHRCDSRAGLVRLARSGTRPTGAVFFYLDAHGFGVLPLAEEIDLVLTHWPEAVLMVDDFAVPEDLGYGFDDYGPGRALTLGYLAEHDVLPAGVWFPACASTAETGFRRGCVVLARAPAVLRRIDTVKTLRRWANVDPHSVSAAP